MNIKKHNNLNIGEQVVSIETNILYAAIEIEYIGDVKLINLLPSDYMIQKGKRKIIILKTNNSAEQVSDLFKYRGKAYITRAKVIESNLNSVNLFVNRSALQLWNVMGLEEWDNLTRNWEDIDFDGNNAKYKYIHKTRTYDNESRQFTTTKEIRKK